MLRKFWWKILFHFLCSHSQCRIWILPGKYHPWKTTHDGRCVCCRELVDIVCGLISMHVLSASTRSLVIIALYVSFRLRKPVILTVLEHQSIPKTNINIYRRHDYIQKRDVSRMSWTRTVSVNSSTMNWPMLHHTSERPKKHYRLWRNPPLILRASLLVFSDKKE